MKKLSETSIEMLTAERGEVAERAAITKASRLAYDDGGRVKYVAEVELEDGQVVGYSRADSGDFDAAELEAAMLGVIETAPKIERTK